MKIKNLAIIVLMITFFIILETKVYATTGKINSETVRLRKEANTSSTILDQLDKGDEVEILEQEDGWYKVKVKTEQGTVTGYINEDLIDAEGEIASEPKENSEDVNSDEKESTETELLIEDQEETSIEETVEVATTAQENDEITASMTETNMSNNIEENNEYTLEQEVSVKILPLINAREKTKISGNIKVAEIINDWVRVENEVDSGWIRKNTLKQSLGEIEVVPQEEQQEVQPTETIEEETEVEEPEETTEPETTEINKIGYVDAEGLKVRKEPNTSSEELDSLSRNDEVEIIGKVDNWYKIKLGDGIGYISAKYISDTKLPETTSRSGSSLKAETTTKTESETQQEENTSEPAKSGTTGAAVVEYAKQYLGYKYVSGGASPETGFDCSGFTSYVYKHFGISLNRTSSDQIKNGVAVEKSDLQPGDIVLFNNDANTRIGHVGIYIGNGNFIHASNPSDGVKITTLESGYYLKRYVGARRVI